MQWQQKLKQNAELFRRLNNSAQGKAAIELLNETFNHPDIIGKDTHDTYYRLGQRDVVEYINQLVKAGTDNE